MFRAATRPLGPPPTMMQSLSTNSLNSSVNSLTIALVMAASVTGVNFSICQVSPYVMI